MFNGVLKGSKETKVKRFLIYLFTYSGVVGSEHRIRMPARRPLAALNLPSPERGGKQVTGMCSRSGGRQRVLAPRPALRGAVHSSHRRQPRHSQPTDSVPRAPTTISWCESATGLAPGYWLSDCQLVCPFLWTSRLEIANYFLRSLFLVTIWYRYRLSIIVFHVPFFTAKIFYLHYLDRIGCQ